MRAYIDRVVEAVLAVLMAAMIVLVFIGVVFRYVLLDPITWGEEVARLCLVWVSFLGVYLAHRRSQHIAVVAVLDELPRPARAGLRVATALLLAVFMAVLAQQGASYALRFADSYSPLLDIPLGLVYAALPLCAALIILDLLATATAELRHSWTDGRGGGSREG